MELRIIDGMKLHIYGFYITVELLYTMTGSSNSYTLRSGREAQDG